MRSNCEKRTVVLTLTNKCNLHCIYCYEGLKDNHSMSFETAKAILDKEFALNENKELQIDFHGGEPLYCFDMIKQLCEWSLSQKRNCKYIFFIGTNGTLLTPTMKKWFVEHKDRVWLGLSLDGTKQMHNINRSNSFDSIDIDFFTTHWPKQSIKMTLSKQTLPDVAKGVIFAHEKGFEVSFNLAYGIAWTDDMLDIYEKQLDILVAYYKAHPALKIAANFDKKLVTVFSQDPLERHCGAGKYMKAYDTYGKEYPCHMFASNTLENNRWAEIANSDFDDETIFEDEECHLCPIYRLCPTCYGMNFIERNNIGKRDKRLCGFNKINTKAICKLRYNNLIDKPNSEITAEEYAELKAVKYLFGQL
ncbi:MAG: radical SAM protein [Acinetobacter sp.]